MAAQIPILKNNYMRAHQILEVDEKEVMESFTKMVAQRAIQWTPATTAKYLGRGKDKVIRAIKKLNLRPISQTSHAKFYTAYDVVLIWEEIMRQENEAL